MKALITGDIHLGKRSAQIDCESDILSTKSSWINIVNYSVGNGVDVVILTGDVVDRDNRYFEASGPLMEGLKILNNNNITTYIISGNHDFDVLPQLVDVAGLKSVRLLGRGGNWDSVLFERGDQTLQVMGWSFPTMHVRSNPLESFPVDIVREDIPTFVVVHGDAYSANTPYAPLDIGRLKALRNVDAVLLGHIHKSEVFNESAPLIFYCGSPHALSPKERGLHGPYILSIESRSISYEHIPLSPVRYEELQIDVSGVADEEEFRKTIHNGVREFVSTLDRNDHLKFVSLDIKLSGSNNRIREIEIWSRSISDLSFKDEFELSIRKVEFDIEPLIDIDSLLNNPSYLGILANAVKDIREQRVNTFVENLKKRWIERYQTMIDSKTYRPLEFSLNRAEIEAEADKNILKECENLLTRLYIQHRDEN